MDVLREYLDYQVFMVRLTHAHAVDTRPFSCVGRRLGTRLERGHALSQHRVQLSCYNRSRIVHAGQNGTKTVTFF